MPEGLEKRLNELMEWTGHEDQREAISTFIVNLHDLGPEGARAALAVLRHQYVPSEEMTQRLWAEGARARGEQE